MRTSAISLITGTDRRKQTLSVVLSCKSPFDMWLLPDNPSSQHIHVCVCARPHAQWLLSLASHGNKLWHHWVALAGRRSYSQTDSLHNQRGFFLGGRGCFVFLFVFVIKEGEAWSKTSICQSMEDCCFSNEQFGDQGQGRHSSAEIPH